MMNKKSICFSSIVLCVILTGCDILPTLIHGEKPEEVIITVTGVSLNKTNTAIAVGGAETLTAVVIPANATNKSLRWNSDDSTIASVTNGVITGKAVGIAVITVTTVDGGKTDSCAVTVSAGSVAVTGVSLNTTSTTLSVGGMETLTPIFTPSNATNQNVTWESNNEAVATVTNGVITGRAIGNAIITVTTEDGGKKASCTVTVSNNIIPVTSVSLSKSSISLTVGGTETLTALVVPSNATNKTITWSSSATGIATVSSSGTVSAVSAGSATITVTTVNGNKTATCAVTVSSTGSLTPAELASYLATLPANTASSPHNIMLKVSNTSEFDTIKEALFVASNKYVKLDLSGSTVITIPDYAFNYYSSFGCTSLTGITIPDGVTSIGGRAFYQCTSLASVILPNSVTSIGGYAFASTGLVSVTFLGTIPSSDFSSYAFYGIGNLRDLFYAIDSSNGTPGIYTKVINSFPIIWTKQN